MPQFKGAQSRKTDVCVVAGTRTNGACYFLPSTPEQMQNSVSRWGTAGACCKPLQHQQLPEPQPHGSPDPVLLGGFKSTEVTTRRPNVLHKQGTERRTLAWEKKTRHCDCFKHMRVQTARVSEPRCQVFPFAARSPGL